MRSDELLGVARRDHEWPLSGALNTTRFDTLEMENWKVTFFVPSTVTTKPGELCAQAPSACSIRHLSSNPHRVQSTRSVQLDSVIGHTPRPSDAFDSTRRAAGPCGREILGCAAGHGG